jgi:biopolymer transport protein ExbD
MKISGRRTYFIGLESTAITDIVLNMFIFFFISFSLLYTFNPHRVQKLDIKLPKAAHTTTIENLQQVNITLTNEGIIYLGDDIVTLKELRERIYGNYRNNPNLIVILRADRLVSFKDIVNILDTLAELGIANLNIATVKE